MQRNAKLSRLLAVEEYMQFATTNAYVVKKSISIFEVVFKIEQFTSLSPCSVDGFLGHRLACSFDRDRVETNIQLFLHTLVLFTLSTLRESKMRLSNSTKTTVAHRSSHGVIPKQIH